MSNMSVCRGRTGFVLATAGLFVFLGAIGCSGTTGSNPGPGPQGAAGNEGRAGYGREGLPNDRVQHDLAQLAPLLVLLRLVNRPSGASDDLDGVVRSDRFDFAVLQGEVRQPVHEVGGEVIISPPAKLVARAEASDGRRWVETRTSNVEEFGR